MANAKICPVCKVNEAELDEYYGYLPCKDCRERQSKKQKPTSLVEFTTDSIREQRRAYAKDIIQPFRKGQLSREYVEEYGTKRIKVSKEEVKNAKYVWNDLGYYKKHD